MYHIGLDIGSTTIKCVVLDEQQNLLYHTYERHYSHIVEKAAEVLSHADEAFVKGAAARLALSGSAGMGFAESCGIPFVQEVYATRIAANRYMPGTDVVIELGGEDAKILFLTNGTEVRMNGSCAGGTGAFIDQMATLLHLTPAEMNEAAKTAQKTYTIASRCGVFAKSDVQPLLNQGASKNDVALSIFGAVVNQTIAGLAQGRPIRGRVLYLGGPLTFLSELRRSFDKALGAQGACPENSLYYVALGAALYAQGEVTLADVTARLREYSATAKYAFHAPLFKNQREYEDFRARHALADVPHIEYTPDCGAIHRHRCGQHHGEGRRHRREGQYRIYQLRAELRQPGAHHPPFPAGDIRKLPRRPRGQRHGHRLWRGACENGVRRRFRRGGDRGALRGCAPFSAGG